MHKASHKLKAKGRACKAENAVPEARATPSHNALHIATPHEYLKWSAPSKRFEWDGFP